MFLNYKKTLKETLKFYRENVQNILLLSFFLVLSLSYFLLFLITYYCISFILADFYSFLDLENSFSHASILQK